MLGNCRVFEVPLLWDILFPWKRLFDLTVEDFILLFLLQ